MSMCNNTQDKNKNVAFSMKWHSPYQLSTSGVVILSFADAGCGFFVVMLNVIILSVFMLSFVALVLIYSIYAV